MRITFVMPGAGLAGGNRVVALHAERLAARGHAVHLVWHRPWPRPWHYRLRQRLRGRRSRAAEGETYFRGLPVTQSVSARHDRVAAADVPDADAVVATWWETAFEVAALPPEKGEKFYFVQHHEVHGHLPDHLSRGSYHLPLRKIAVSGWLVDVMAREYGDRDVALVPNAVDPRLFHAPPRARNAVPTVGLMYSTTPYKGIDVAVRAIELARRAVPDLAVVAFGKHDVSPRLPLPPGTRYVRNPAQEEIREIYAACDLWLMASRSEGFGLPLLEAMACRTPVASTRVGAAADLVDDGVEGWVVAVDDAAALGRRIVDLARLSPEAWRAMSDAALARALAYGWDDAADRFEAALLGQPRTGCRKTG